MNQIQAYNWARTMVQYCPTSCLPIILQWEARNILIRKQPWVQIARIRRHHNHRVQSNKLSTSNSNSTTTIIITSNKLSQTAAGTTLPATCCSRQQVAQVLPHHPPPPLQTQPLLIKSEWELELEQEPELDTHAKWLIKWRASLKNTT